MKSRLISILVLIVASWSCDITSPGTFREVRRDYSPDSSKFLLAYEYAQGAWDGGRSHSVTIMQATDSVIKENFDFSYSSYDFDNIYWIGNDTVMIEESFTEFLSSGRSKLKDTTLSGVYVKIAQRDPIDSSFTRKIFFQETSPDAKQVLLIYKYVKPQNGDYFLNISIIPKGTALPKFGNFYVSRWGFDCFTDIRWDQKSQLDIKVSEACYYSFDQYLVKNKPPVKFKVAINDEPGNIRMYMQ